jgi:hypothetical protein
MAEKSALRPSADFDSIASLHSIKICMGRENFMHSSRKDSTEVFTLGHSPDPDDAIMFYAMAENKIDLRGYRFDHRLQVFRRSMSGRGAASCIFPRSRFTRAARFQPSQPLRRSRLGVWRSATGRIRGGELDAAFDRPTPNGALW